MFFGPYKDGYALYTVARDGTPNIYRIRYTNTSDVAPIVSEITVNATNPLEVVINEVLLFSASNTTDNDGDRMRFEWDFGDGTNATRRNPTKQYKQKGKKPSKKNNLCMTHSLSQCIS
jgi:PKD repeat protein